MSRDMTSAGPLRVAVRLHEAGDSVGLSLHLPRVSHYYHNRLAPPGLSGPSRSPVPCPLSRNCCEQLPLLSVVLCARPQGLLSWHRL